MSGRALAWQRQQVFLNQQTYPHQRIQLIICDTSQDTAFTESVQAWISRSDYPCVKHFLFNAARPGIAEEGGRSSEIDLEIHQVCCRIYNRIQPEVENELVWILEDDIIPPIDVLERLLAHLQDDVATVSAPYYSRMPHDRQPFVWTTESKYLGIPRALPPHPDAPQVTEIGGSGFGCLLVRSSLFKSWEFRVEPPERYFDPAFFAGMDQRWRRLCDWSCICVHLPERPPSQFRSFRLCRSPESSIGVGQHRIGWPAAVASLANLASDQGILFDDCIEQTFCHSLDGRFNSWRVPWAGILHHTPRMDRSPLERHTWLSTLVFENEGWIRSLSHLRGLLVLSEYVAQWLRPRVPCPIGVVRHPVDRCGMIPWNADAWVTNPRLLQVGWFQRNTRAIHQVPPIIRREALKLTAWDWVERYDRKMQQHWANLGTRQEFGGVHEYRHRVSDAEYDALLSTSVVLTEVLDASANNTVLECMVRRTPLLINRHPAVIEYLGAGYPLFFDDLKQVPALLPRVFEAHAYLESLNLDHLSYSAFAKSVVEFLKGL